MIEPSSSVDDYMDDLEDAVDRLIDRSEQLAKENKELKREVETLTNLIRDLQWKLNGAVKPYGDKL
jgi:cell division septum initiation protein DivIVA